MVGLSGFLTLAFDSMKETIAAFDAAGLRNDFKIMIGGGQIDETVRSYTGADAFGVNAVEAVGLCRNWLGWRRERAEPSLGRRLHHARPLRAERRRQGRLRRALGTHHGLRAAGAADRMPVGMHSFFWPATHGGITFKELMYDYGKAKKACLDVVTEFEPDGVFPLLMGTALGRGARKAGLQAAAVARPWRGRDAALPVPGPRVHEGRGVRRVSFDPTGFYIHTYLPRVAGAFEGFDKLPDFLGLHYFRLVHGIRPLRCPKCASRSTGSWPPPKK